MFRIDRSMVNVTNIELIRNGSDPEVEVVSDAAQTNARLEAELLLKVQEAEEDCERCRQMAQQLVKDAASEADGLRKEAEMDGLSIRANAYKEGFEEGKKEAKAEDEARRKQDIEDIRNLLSSIEQARDEMFASIEPEFVALCLETVKKIVNTAVENDDKVFESLIKNALRHMKREGKITIRVSNREYERFFQDGNAVFVLGDEAVNATIVDDPLLPELGCIIESDSGTVNAGVDSQIKYLTLAFNRAGKD